MDEYREKLELLIKIRQVVRDNKNLYIPDNDSLMTKDLYELRKIHRDYIEPLFFQENQKHRIEAEERSKILDKEFDKVNSDNHLFQNEIIDARLTIEFLLQLKQEYIFKYLGGVIDLDLPIYSYFMDNLNRVSFFVVRFMLCQMKQDGHLTLGEVLKSKKAKSYLDMRQVLTKYTLLHCQLDHHIKFLKNTKSIKLSLSIVMLDYSESL